MANPDKFPTSLVAGIAVTLAVTAYLVLPTLGGGPDVDMSEEAVLQRIKPIGSVNTTQAKPAPAPAPATKQEKPAATAGEEKSTAGSGNEKPAEASTDTAETKAASAARSGEEIFNASCTACHSTGAAGAPKIGDKEAWAPRIATGMDALMKSAINGKKSMPPRGTCMDCSDDELKSAVEYMVSKSK